MILRLSVVLIVAATAIHVRTPDTAYGVQVNASAGAQVSFDRILRAGTEPNTWLT